MLKELPLFHYPIPRNPEFCRGGSSSCAVEGEALGLLQVSGGPRLNKFYVSRSHTTEDGCSNCILVRRLKCALSEFQSSARPWHPLLPCLSELLEPSEGWLFSGSTRPRNSSQCVPPSTVGTFRMREHELLHDRGFGTFWLSSASCA